MNPVGFNSVEVNFGNAWRTSTNVVVIPLMGDGMYYVNLFAGTCASDGFIITLNLNGKPVFTIYHFLATWYRASVREKAAIINLSIGDTLSVTMPSSSYCIYGGSTEKQTAFSGFRLA